MPTRPPKRPARIPASRDYLWKALRLMHRGTARELAAVTERPRNSISVDLRLLVATGYVAVVAGTYPHVFRLVRDTGPNPPMFMFKPGSPKKRLWGAIDRNTREAYGVHGAPAPATGRRFNWLPKRALQPGKEAAAE